jgi:hypothetical protein
VTNSVDLTVGYNAAIAGDEQTHAFSAGLKLRF